MPETGIKTSKPTDGIFKLAAQPHDRDGERRDVDPDVNVEGEKAHEHARIDGGCGDTAGAAEDLESGAGDRVCA